jgi:hypothetical protein
MEDQRGLETAVGQEQVVSQLREAFTVLAHGDSVGSVVESYRLSAIGYRLSAIGYRLSAVGYRLSAIGCRLSAISYRASANG